MVDAILLNALVARDASINRPIRRPVPLPPRLARELAVLPPFNPRRTVRQGRAQSARGVSVRQPRRALVRTVCTGDCAGISGAPNAAACA